MTPTPSYSAQRSDSIFEMEVALRELRQQYESNCITDSGFQAVYDIFDSLKHNSEAVQVVSQHRFSWVFTTKGGRVLVTTAKWAYPISTLALIALGSGDYWLEKTDFEECIHQQEGFRSTYLNGTDLVLPPVSEYCSSNLSLKAVILGGTTAATAISFFSTWLQDKYQQTEALYQKEREQLIEKDVRQKERDDQFVVFMHSWQEFINSKENEHLKKCLEILPTLAENNLMHRLGLPEALTSHLVHHAEDPNVRVHLDNLHRLVTTRRSSEERTPHHGHRIKRRARKRGERGGQERLLASQSSISSRIRNETRALISSIGLDEGTPFCMRVGDLRLNKDGTFSEPSQKRQSSSESFTPPLAVTDMDFHDSSDEEEQKSYDVWRKGHAFQSLQDVAV